MTTEALRNWIEANGVKQADLIRALDVPRYDFYNAIKREQVPQWLLDGLELIGIKASKGRFYGTFKVEPSIYTSEWLKASIRRLIEKGAIQKKKDLTATGYDAATIAGMCSVYSPSKNFVQVFLDMYGQYLTPEVKIQVKLSGKRLAEIILPEGYTKEDLEKVKRALK